MGFPGAIGMAGVKVNYLVTIIEVKDSAQII